MPDPTMTTPSELFTHPRPRCVVTTVYSDPAVSLTVQAWRRELCSYYLLFRIANQYSLTLNETAVFYFFRRRAGNFADIWELKRLSDYDKIWYGVVDLWRKGLIDR